MAAETVPTSRGTAASPSRMVVLPEVVTPPAPLVPGAHPGAGTDTEPAGRGPGEVLAKLWSKVSLRTLRDMIVEGTFVVVLLWFYREGRHFASGHVTRAEHNAAWVWHLERTLHLFSEQHVQAFLLSSTTLVHLANRYYVSVHFPLTATFLFWLFVRHRAQYALVRRTLVLVTLFGLVFTLLMPLAPPRLFAGDGLIDTMQVYGPSAYNPDTIHGLANQYAAMPSLHVAWSSLVAITVVRVSTSRFRWLIIAHPVITLIVVVGTANHYWLDGIVGLMLLGISALIVYRPPLVRRPAARVVDRLRATS